MSTPVICASIDFFPPVDAFKKHDKMRLQRAPLALFPVFHSGFHKISFENGKRKLLLNCVK